MGFNAKLTFFSAVLSISYSSPLLYCAVDNAQVSKKNFDVTKYKLHSVYDWLIKGIAI